MVNLVDLKELYYALRYSERKTNGCDVWQFMPQKRFEGIVKHLSDIGTPERKLIREILGKKYGLERFSILEAGCGTATELTGYKKYGFSVDYTGLDISPRMLQTARERHKDIRFVQGDVRELEFKDKSFDVVLLRHVLEHLPDYNDAVGEAVRVAKKSVIVDFFIAPTQLPFDMTFWYKQGYYENWYSKRKFDNFVDVFPLSRIDREDVVGSVGQSAMIYVLDKDFY